MALRQVSGSALETVDYSYYNLTVWNDNVEPQEATINVKVRDIILAKPEDYYLSIIRFNMPNNFMILLNLDTNDAVNLMANGNDYFVNVGTVDQDRVITVHQYLEVLNVALAASFASMKLGEGGATPAIHPPRMIWNKDTKHFSLMVPKLGYRLGDGGAGSAPEVEIWFSAELRERFGYLRSAVPEEPPSSVLLFTDSRIVVSAQEDLYTIATATIGPFLDPVLFPATTYYQVKDEYPSIQFWNYTSKLVFTSNAIPVIAENSGDFAVDSDPKTNSNTPIITDFNVNPNDPFGPRGIIQFSPVSQWRLSSLTGGSSFRGIGLNIHRLNKDGSREQVFLPPGGYFSVKIAFIRREAVKHGLSPEVIS